MSNPVFNRLNKEWTATTPAGYPTMPGYQVGGAATQTQTPYPSGAGYAQAAQQAQPFGQTRWDAAAMEQNFAGPAADAVDRGRMTYDDVIVKTAISFGVLVLAAAPAWFLALANPSLGFGLITIGFIAGLVLALVNTFSKTIRPALVLAYAGAEGLALGAFSAFMEYAYPGIVVEALIGTIAVFGVTLALFASGKVRNSPILARFALIAVLGILVYRLLNWILVLTGVLSGSGMNDVTIFGIPLGVAVGVLAVIVGAVCLIQDFDQARIGVAAGAPAKFAWACAFAIMVTVVWMYLEILQLLARLRD